MKTFHHRSVIFSGVLFWTLLIFSSCKKFLEVDLPATLVPEQVVFSDEASATSAVKGLYVDLITLNSFSGGAEVCAATLTGLSSDELNNYRDRPEYIGFEQNNLAASDGSVKMLWTSIYKTIYDANAIIEGLEDAKLVSAAVKDQLMGEALFIRAYCNFYSVNLFGDVPLATSTNYQANATISRVSVTAVYDHIKKDLTEAQSLLGDVYQGSADRIRVNKFTAIALLARVHLYLEDWQGAEAMSSLLIENNTVYEISPDLNQVFLAAGKEAIWQLQLPPSTYFTTREGFHFIVTTEAELNNVLNNDLISAFEPGDRRKTNWIGSFLTGTGTVYFPYKYKKKTGSSPPVTAVENSTVFRLAEQFLIRAEARAHLDKLSDAIGDVDSIRNRAGLPLIHDINPAISKQDLLLAIEKERRVELFTEGAHRWFDLKRTGRIDAVLSTLKAPNWQPADALYPIPQDELIRNPNLGDQNPNY